MISNARNTTRAGIARERGRERVDGTRQQMADRAERIADAVESTADRLASEGEGAIGNYGLSFAGLMRRAAGSLRQRSLGELGREITTFAQHHPAAFLAGSVALGFGLSRFMKASARRTDEHVEEDSEGSADPESAEPEARNAASPDDSANRSGAAP